MIRFTFIIIALSLCICAEAQLGIKPMLKAGVRTEGNGKFLSYESGGVSENTRYTYNAAVYIPKFHTSIEWTYREQGRNAFLKVPNFLIKKPKITLQNQPSRLAKAGDTLGTYLEFYPNWFSISFNLLPNKWKKHQLLLGGGIIKREGGLLYVDRTVDHTWGREAFIKIINDVSQKTILWKSEYIFMPFKYSLLSLRCNYAYFSKFPHGYYEFILSLGTYIDL